MEDAPCENCTGDPTCPTESHGERTNWRRSCSAYGQVLDARIQLWFWMRRPWWRGFHSAARPPAVDGLSCDPIDGSFGDAGDPAGDVTLRDECYSTAWSPTNAVLFTTIQTAMEECLEGATASTANHAAINLGRLSPPSNPTGFREPRQQLSISEEIWEPEPKPNWPLSATSSARPVCAGSSQSNAQAHTGHTAAEPISITDRVSSSFTATCKPYTAPHSRQIIQRRPNGRSRHGEEVEPGDDQPRSAVRSPHWSGTGLWKPRTRTRTRTNWPRPWPWPRSWWTGWTDYGWWSRRTTSSFNA